ncbi:MAG: CvpA family protein [Clostridiales bacterium]|nr:CvpA family protein [Clostridiales bacterium]
MNWLLIAVSIVLCGCIIHGWRLGLLKLLFSLISWIAMIVLISYISPYISNFLGNTLGVYGLIEKQCEKTLQTRLGTGLEFLASQGAEAAAELILKGMVFIITLIIVVILLRIVYRFLGIANHIPIIKGINRILGLAGGLVEGYILVSLFFLFVSVIAGSQLGILLTEYIEDSEFLSFLYYYNVLINVV